MPTLWIFTDDHELSGQDFLLYLRQCRASLAKQYDAAGFGANRDPIIAALGALHRDIRAVRAVRERGDA